MANKKTKETKEVEEEKEVKGIEEAPVSVDMGSGKDVSVETYVRATPFGIEVWDPEEKRTTMKSNG